MLTVVCIHSIIECIWHDNIYWDTSINVLSQFQMKKNIISPKENNMTSQVNSLPTTTKNTVCEK